MARNLILPVQWLRGIAAVMVVWFHACQPFGITEAVAAPFGANGVYIFFVISGFIMVAISKSRPCTPGEFFLDRFTRVAPLYWAVTLMMVVLYLLQPQVFKTFHPRIQDLVQSLLFIPHYSERWPEQVTPLLMPGWTLTYEMFFYVIFSISLFYRARSTWVLLTICSVFVLCGYLLGPFTNALLKTYTDPVLLEFALGALIGEAYVRGFSIKSGWLALLVGGLGLACMVHGPSGPSLTGRLVQGVGPVLLVAACLRNDVKWDNKLLHVLGDASYSIYLTQFLTLTILFKLGFAFWRGPIDPIVAIVAAVTATVISALVGWVVFKWVERPLTRAVRSWVMDRVRRLQELPGGAAKERGA